MKKLLESKGLNYVIAVLGLGLAVVAHLLLGDNVIAFSGATFMVGYAIPRISDVWFTSLVKRMLEAMTHPSAPQEVKQAATAPAASQIATFLGVTLPPPVVATKVE